MFFNVLHAVVDVDSSNSMSGAGFVQINKESTVITEPIQVRVITG